LTRTITKTKFPPAPPPSLTRVAAYARVSSGKDEMLHSLAAQVSYYSEYIQKHPGWLYSGVYADEAMTGTKDDRPEFQRMLADCRNSKIDRIITKSISRFARNTVTLLETVRELKSLGVDVYFEEQNIHSVSGDGELMLTILASYAQEESLSVSENCKWRIRSQFKQGEMANFRFMYGYRITKAGIAIDPEQAAVVRQMFTDYLNGDGCGVIARKLREKKVPALRGEKWSSNHVAYMLKNEKYTGNALLQKRFVKDHLTKALVINYGELPKYYAEGTHEATIDVDTFERAQEIMSESRKRGPAKNANKNRYAFSSKIRCQKCGKNYKRLVARGSAKWNCSTYLNSGKTHCSGGSIPEDSLMTLVAKVMGQKVFDAAIFNDHISELVVGESNNITFNFKDGHSIETTWQDRSRRDSWTDEMKRAASIRTTIQRRGDK